MKKSNQRLSIYISCFLLVVFFGLLIIQEAHFLFLFLLLIGIGSLIGLWHGYYKIVKEYQALPYLVLDEVGVTLNQKNTSQFIAWQEIKNIDVNLHIIVNDNRPRTHIIQKFNNEIFELNDDLIADKITETIILLRRYAEHYGTAKFIY